MEAPTIDNLQRLTLRGKEDCPIAYTTYQLHKASCDSPSRTIWIVFVNGLGLPQAFWQPTLQLLKTTLLSTSSLENVDVYTSTYDRYGQGHSLPADCSNPRSHDITDSISDLNGILDYIRTTHLSHVSFSRLSLVMGAHSIGVPLTRLFIQHYNSAWPVAGALFLDSNMASIEMVDLLPQTTCPDFNPSLLPADTTVDQLEWSRKNYQQRFSPSAPNGESLDRSTLPQLLPYADQPVLAGPGGGNVKLVVVAHDPDTFAEEGMQISTRGLVERYIEPAWRDYNLGLLKLDGSQSVKVEDIVIAKAAGHFVQRDNPGVVAGELVKLLNKITKDSQ